MFDLYKGATRPPSMFGVPTDALLWTFVGFGVLSTVTSIVAWVMFPIIVFIMRLITKRDDRAFRQWGLFVDTKFRCNRTVQSFWGATSYVPLKLKNKWRSWNSKDLKK